MNKTVSQSPKKVIKNKQSGFAEIGILMAVVFGLIGLTIAVAVWFGQIERWNAGGVSQEMNTSARNISGIYEGDSLSTKYTGLNPTNAKPHLTKTFKNNITGSNINIEWGATLSIGPSSYTGAAGTTNQLWTVTNVPQKACHTLLKGVATEAKVILSGTSGTTALMDDNANDPLTGVERSTLCPNDAPTNSFRVIYK